MISSSVVVDLLYLISLSKSLDEYVPLIRDLLFRPGLILLIILMLVLGFLMSDVVVVAPIAVALGGRVIAYLDLSTWIFVLLRGCRDLLLFIISSAPLESLVSNVYGDALNEN